MLRILEQGRNVALPRRPEIRVANGMKQRRALLVTDNLRRTQIDNN